ncbi:MAG: hypothetical protein ACI8VZ_002494 [Candidatus Paceibacteria bacterium]
MTFPYVLSTKYLHKGTKEFQDYSNYLLYS